MRPVALLVALLLAAPAAAQDATAGLGPRLARIAAEAEQRGPEAALALARRGRMKTSDDGRIAVVLEPANSRWSSRIDRKQLRALDAEVSDSSRSLLEVWVPVHGLRRLASHPGVRLVRAPRRAIPMAGMGAVVSEGVALTGGEALFDAGIIGAGVSVAVLDVGFQWLSNTQSEGELPSSITTVDEVGTGMEQETRHGTAVAEMVVDMAPAVDLTLIRVDTDVDFENAVDYINANGIDVVNLSLNWVNASYYEDTGHFNDLVNTSHDVHGVFWAVASGNWAKKHFRGGWLDDDSDSQLDFVSGDDRLELSGSSSDVCVYLTWNQWSGSVSTNLDLYLYANGKPGPVASSTSVHGSGPFKNPDPTEALCHPYDTGEAPYEVEVRRASGSIPGSLDVTLFSPGNEVEHAVASSSFLDPAPAHGAFSVGAINVFAWLDPNPPIEDFSSRGPTNDGRSKPEIVGPNRVNSFSRGFNTKGTSFASPHVAGAAALLLEQDPSLMPPGIAALLQVTAVDQGAPGIDDSYGAGQLDLEVITGGAFDSDGDSIADIPDNCAYVWNLDQRDTGQVGGPGSDGIGDVCQCGDAAEGASVIQSDVDQIRDWLAGLVGSLSAPDKCNVRGPSDGGVTDCDAADVAVIRRALALMGPGVQQACEPALPPVP